MQKLADAIDVTKRTPLALLQLSLALKRGDDDAAAVSLLVRAQQQYPGDFGINITLGQAFLYTALCAIFSHSGSENRRKNQGSQVIMALLTGAANLPRRPPTLEIP